MPCMSAFKLTFKIASIWWSGVRVKRLVCVMPAQFTRTSMEVPEGRMDPKGVLGDVLQKCWLCVMSPAM